MHGLLLFSLRQRVCMVQYQRKRYELTDIMQLLRKKEKLLKPFTPSASYGVR